MVASVCVDCGKQCSSVRCRQCYRKSVGASAHIERTCGHCGCTFRRPSRKPKANGQPRDANKYCSQDCFYEAVTAGTQQFKGRLFGVNAQMADWFMEWDDQRIARDKCLQRLETFHPCEQCGNATDNPRFCSTRCMFAWRGTVACACGAIIADATWRTRACDSCVKKHRRKHPHSYRKRCRKYGGHYNSKCTRKGVLERDSFRCHVCHRKCLSPAMLRLKGYDHNHPRSATVDHYPVPLSKGGDHDWDNVKCACRQCNSERGATWDGQKRMSFR